MKKKIVVLLALMMILSGCSTTKNSSTKHLNAAFFWVSTNLDPADDYNGWVVSRSGLGETLVKLNDNYEIEGQLADTWQQVNDNTWSFHLRDNVTFSNGKAVDANAVKACLERTFAKNSRAESYFELEHIEANGQDLTIVTKEPNGALLNNLVEPLFTIYDSSDSDENIANKPACTGPYEVTSFKTAAKIELKANDNYWDGKVGLDTISIKQVADSDSRVLAMQSGETDLTGTIDYANLKLFTDNDKYHVSQVIGPRCNVIYLNNASTFLKDKTLRQALSYCVDRQSIVAITGGEVATGLFSSVLAFGQGVSDKYAYSIDEAKMLLDQAGYVDTNNDGIREMNGQNIVLGYYETADHGSSDANTIAQSVQASAKKAGIQIDLHQAENLADIRTAGTFDLCSANDSTAPTGDPEIFLQIHYASNVASNYGRYSNSTVDALMGQLKSTFNLEARSSIAKQANELILNDAGSIYVSYVPLNTVTSAKVKNAKQHPVDYYIIDKSITVE